MIWHYFIPIFNVKIKIPTKKMNFRLTQRFQQHQHQQHQHQQHQHQQLQAPKSQKLGLINQRLIRTSSILKQNLQTCHQIAPGARHLSQITFMPPLPPATRFFWLLFH